jgi:hypothetical protein
MVKTKARLVRIGNSRGVRLPKPLIEQVGLSDEVVPEVKLGGRGQNSLLRTFWLAVVFRIPGLALLREWLGQALTLGSMAAVGDRFWGHGDRAAVPGAL